MVETIGADDGVDTVGSRGLRLKYQLQHRHRRGGTLSKVLQPKIDRIYQHPHNRGWRLEGGKDRIRDGPLMTRIWSLSTHPFSTDLLGPQQSIRKGTEWQGI